MGSSAHVPSSETDTKLLAETMDPATVNTQVNSPLFTVLPPEIRCRIFKLALCPAPDLEHPYDRKASYYPPGLEGKPCSSIAVLLTCRRAYLENALLPTVVVERPYFWHVAPPGYAAYDNPVNALRRLRPALQPFAAVRVYLQNKGGSVLEDQFRRQVLLNPDFRPAHLALSLPRIQRPKKIFGKREWQLRISMALPGKTSDANCGWTPWLRAVWPSNSWGQALGNIGSLQTFELELETADWEVGLHHLVERAEAWDFRNSEKARRAVEGNLVYDPKAIRFSCWRGHRPACAAEDPEAVQISSWRGLRQARTTEARKMRLHQRRWICMSWGCFGGDKSLEAPISRPTAQSLSLLERGSEEITFLWFVPMYPALPALFSSDRSDSFFSARPSRAPQLQVGFAAFCRRPLGTDLDELSLSAVRRSANNSREMSSTDNTSSLILLRFRRAYRPQAGFAPFRQLLHLLEWHSPLLGHCVACLHESSR